MAYLPGTEYHLNLCLKTTEPLVLLATGHVLASEQFLLPWNGGKAAEVKQASAKALMIEKNDSIITVKGDGFELKFDKMAGTIGSFRVGNSEMIRQGPLPNFRRALTDNDIGNRLFERTKPWFDASEKRTIESAEISHSADDELRFRVVFDFPALPAKEIVEYTILSNGQLHITGNLKVMGDKVPELPRFGMNMRISQLLGNVEYYGRGPWENYQDRRTSAFVGRYKTRCDSMYTPYVRPQESGYRTDVRWVKLTDDLGNGLLIEADSLIGFSALPFDYTDLATYAWGGKHINDLVVRDFIDLNIDHLQMGVGGDDSWGARVHNQYTLPAKNYRYGFRLIPEKR
jgi:beta-galactosidase